MGMWSCVYTISLTHGLLWCICSKLNAYYYNGVYWCIIVAQYYLDVSNSQFNVFVIFNGFPSTATKSVEGRLPAPSKRHSTSLRCTLTSCSGAWGSRRAPIRPSLAGGKGHRSGDNPAENQFQKHVCISWIIKLFWPKQTAMLGITYIIMWLGLHWPRSQVLIYLQGHFSTETCTTL